MKIKPLIGVLHGQESEFPTALIEYINNKKADNIKAETIKIGDIPLNYESKYRLIIDRISYKVPYYSTFLKAAILDGTYVINDPFWFDSHDHFFNYGLVSRLEIPVPKTVCLPSRAYSQLVESSDLTNMVFPLNWKKVIDYVGLPAMIKPYDDLGWQNEIIVNTEEELLAQYNKSGEAIMIVQELIHYDSFVRCFVVGKKGKKQKVLPVGYDPENRTFNTEGLNLTEDLLRRLESKSKKICQVLGYDMNSIDFAINKSGAYAIDFMNPVPALSAGKIGQENFDWVVKHLGDLAIDYVHRDVSSYEDHHWYNQAGLKRRPRRKKHQ